MNISAINYQKSPNFNANFKIYECPVEKILKDTKGLLSEKTIEAFSNRIKKLGSEADFVAISLMHGIDPEDKADFDYTKVNTKIICNHYFKDQKNSVFYGEVGKVYGSKEERASKTKFLIDHYLKILENSFKK